MFSFSIVINFKIFKNTLSCLGSCLIIIKINPFCFYCVEKTFDNCVIITITFCTHTLAHIGFC